ncbi:protein FRA10AC1 isoform X3 [Ricinus communis]|uniref:protein FRA10AC1 isoform X3 n=1 Tax=Ricinus communis TaxID=3988 RepID=UPI00201AA0EC|nr:protein FRA10AC1 isoform X3 [Ricinus communis]
MASFGSLKSTIYDKEERKQQYQSYIRGLNAYDRHKKFLNDYVSFYGKENSTNLKLPIKTDKDTLREGYRFIRTAEDDMDTSWEQRLVKRYYDKLFKNTPLSLLRTSEDMPDWLEMEDREGSYIWESSYAVTNIVMTKMIYQAMSNYLQVNFSYFEAGENKQALVKLVACKRCAEKLNYKNRKEKQRLERREKEEIKRKRERLSSNVDSDDEKSKNKRKKVKEEIHEMAVCY